MSRPTISVCVMTRNEEKRIKEFLDSLIDFADEIIISDIESSDKTVEIITSYQNPKIKLFNRKEEYHFGIAKNFAMHEATQDYILVLDPDERLSGDFKKHIHSFLKDTKPEVVSIVRVDDLLTSLKENIERIVKRGNRVFHGIDEDSKVHEHFVHTFKVENFPYPIWHCQREKHWLVKPHSRFHYLFLEIERTPKTKSFFGHFVRGLWMFQYKFKRVYYRQNLKENGLTGFYYALLRAWYAFLIQVFIGLKDISKDYWKNPEYEERIK